MLAMDSTRFCAGLCVMMGGNGICASVVGAPIFGMGSLRGARAHEGEREP